ncbi:SPAG16 isoform 2 [Pongo abelii]|uniref:SPAG16 isoform 2 n=1 Tax=Pongo abelii TaxID=9601 RepID=A0A2J8STN6_PONAB|nr:SPAG16 isoform 2 [Pongo abelii]
MAAQRGMRSSAVRVLEEALGMGLTAAEDARDTADAVAAEGAYYLEPYLYPLLLLLND